MEATTLGIMDMISSAAGQLGGGDKEQLTGGLMQELDSRGGVGSLFQAFQGNGLGGLVQQWAGGNTAPASPDQVEQGLSGTGLVEGVAQRTGSSPSIVKMGLGMILPVLIHHFVSNGHVTSEGEPTGAPPPDSGGLMQSVLSKLL